jgi:hypothetical protein
MEKLKAFKKKYPLSYPDELTSLIDDISLGGNVFLTGSSSMRNQMYGSDYDAHNIIRLTEPTKERALHILAEKFRKIIRLISERPTTFISDIKAGSRDDWRILRKDARLIDGKITNYDPDEARAKIDSLLEEGILTKEEAQMAHTFIKDHPTIQEFLDAKGKLKYHVLRWKVKEVIDNKKILRDKSAMTLEEAFNCPITTKIDVVTLLQKNRFVEVSMNYEFYNNGHLLNPDDINWEGSFQEGIKGFVLAGNYFKVLKRCYSMAREAEDLQEMERIRNVLNGDLGRLYNVSGDISLLVEILEDHPTAPLEAIRYEIDQFSSRLSQIYALKDYLKREHLIMKELHTATHATKPQMITSLRHVKKIMNKIVQKEAKKILKREFNECLRSVTAKQAPKKHRTTRKKARLDH